VLTYFRKVGVEKIHGRKFMGENSWASIQTQLLELLKIPKFLFT